MDALKNGQSPVDAGLDRISEPIFKMWNRLQDAVTDNLL
jgi:hypothetical protein